MRVRLLYAVLAASLAFNLGFSGTLAINHLRSPSRSARPENLCEASYPESFNAECGRLTCELEPLRHRQARESRRLAELLAARTPDRDEITRCLDRLADTARSIQGLVVDTVITQKELLPEAERAEFCSRVHMSLCQPWGGCRTGTCTLCENNQRTRED